MSACESAENAGKCAEAKRRVDSAKPNPKGAQASARLAAELAAHPFSPRTRHLAVTSLRSCARLRLRGYPPLRFGAFLRNHEIAIGCESVAAAPPSPRRPPCLPAFPAVARGAPTIRIARSADPRLHVYLKAPHPLADTAVRLRAEYRPLPHDAVSPASDASRHPCALGSPVALHLARSRCSS